MNKSIDMCTLSLFILMLVIAVLVAVLAGPTSPLTWSLAGVLVLIPVVRKKFMDRKRIDWSDKYSVGIDSIDEQHKKLINLINTLQTIVDYSTGEEFEREALAELVDYTKTHFTYEEGLMEDNGYPDFEAHKAQHRAMIAEVEAVLAEYENDQDTAMRHAVDYLQDWLIHHINGTDKQYSSFLIGKGVN